MAPLLTINDLHGTAHDIPVLNGVNLSINPGEVHLLFGPNGSGKSTLLSTVMGLPGYRITGGTLTYHDAPVDSPAPDRMAGLGIGLAFQHPPALKGVSLERFLEAIDQNGRKEAGLELLQLASQRHREIGVGFSGGELKRLELLKLYVQNPSLLLLDEPESGVDLEHIAVIAAAVKQLLNDPSTRLNGAKSALIITHTGYILDYLDADAGHLFMDGRIVCSADPKAMFATIRSYGYQYCAQCLAGNKGGCCESV